MENLSYIALSQQMALRRSMNVTANNLANMNTPGFKTQNIMFLEYVNKINDAVEKKISQVEDYGTYRDISQGALTATGNNLDLAVNGNGFFAIETPQGVRYTRDGAFTLNDKKEIVNKSGYRVLNQTGGALNIQPNAAEIKITPDGTVATDQGNVGKLKFVTFNNLNAMIPIGGGLYDVGQAQEQPVDKNAQVLQGMRENSNVQPILEMNRMIEILRAYQSAQNMIQTDHDRQRNTIQKLTRV